MALPVALFAMIAGMALASAAVVSTVNVQQGSHRDASTKSAIAVADAGANIARSRIDRYAVVLATKPCLKLGASGVLEGADAESDGWCPAVTGTVGGGKYTYRVSPAGSTCGEYKLCVVATGTVGRSQPPDRGRLQRIGGAGNDHEKTSGEKTSGEERPAPARKRGSTGFEGLIGQEAIELNGNADIRVGVGTNGNVTADGNADVCGDIRHGVGKKWTHDRQRQTVPRLPGDRRQQVAAAGQQLHAVQHRHQQLQLPAGQVHENETDAENRPAANWTPTAGNRSSTKPWNPTTQRRSASPPTRP